ncbi:polysaccharide biosynthesis/export family protein [Sphingomonas quercus]|uniref:Polysaccharide export protein n=1 Tax=Sphingomonas quercus TaxID=2842451 RepID=A0ABS6BIZ2_9SPHN|nr:polysaccharide biosynthesis/export family protein [Sphingomonas quercus]MBU3077155.1 polysaccharide export protein [Sphingomonas quercus]
MVKSNSPAQRMVALLTASSLSLAGCASLPSSGPTAKQVVRETQPDINAMGMRIFDVDAGTVAGLEARPVEDPNTPLTPLAALARAGRVDVIGPGDTLQVSIFEVGASLFAPGAGLQISESAMDTAAARRGAVSGMAVDEEGTISVPYVGRLVVAGKTPNEAAAMIEAGLKGKSQSPQVVVSLAQSRASTVLVSGQARNPGRYQLSGARETLLDIVADAGGTTGATAGGGDNPEDILVRFTRGTTTVHALLSDIRSHSVDDLVLLPRDRIELIRQERSYTVFGAAGRLDQRPFGAPSVSLAEAIARAGGPADNLADPTAVFLFRYAPGQDPKSNPIPTIYRLNLMKPSSYFLAQRFAMRDKDVIYVANASANSAAKLVQIINLLFSPVTAAAVTVATVNRK